MVSKRVSVASIADPMGTRKYVYWGADGGFRFGLRKFATSFRSAEMLGKVFEWLEAGGYFDSSLVQVWGYRGTTWHPVDVVSLEGAKKEFCDVA